MTEDSVPDESIYSNPFPPDDKAPQEEALSNERIQSYLIQIVQKNQALEEELKSLKKQRAELQGQRKGIAKIVAAIYPENQDFEDLKYFALQQIRSFVIFIIIWLATQGVRLITLGTSEFTQELISLAGNLEAIAFIIYFVAKLFGYLYKKLAIGYWYGKADIERAKKEAMKDD